MEVCQNGIFSLQPATQILPGQRGRGVCREGGEASITPHVHSPIPSLFPFLSVLTCLFSSARACSFLCRYERQFLLLETLLRRGVRCCNLCRSRSVFKKGEGTWPRPPAPDLSWPQGFSPPSRAKESFPSFSYRMPAATFSENDHTCAYSRFEERWAEKPGNPLAHSS